MAKKITAENFKADYYESQNVFENVDGYIKNKNFVQFYDNNNVQLLELIMKDSTAAAVFVFMARYCENNNTIHVSNVQLQEVLKKSESTIKRSIRTLKNLNFITVIKTGRDNIYFINPQIVCNTGAKYKNRLVHLYMKYKKTTDVEHIDASLVDERKHQSFRNRKKYIFKFSTRETGIEKYETDELAELVEKVLEEQESKKKDALIAEMDEMFGPVDWEKESKSFKIK